MLIPILLYHGIKDLARWIKSEITILVISSYQIFSIYYWANLFKVVRVIKKMIE